MNKYLLGIILCLAVSAQATEPCSIWGEYADNFAVDLWGTKMCCSPVGTMCEHIQRKSSLSKLLFDKLDKAQSLYKPTRKKISTCNGIPQKERLCPDKRTRIIISEENCILQYRPYSTLEVQGSFSENFDLWMDRFCSFDAEQLFSNTKEPLSPEARPVTQQHQPNSKIKTAQFAVPAVAAETIQPAAPLNPQVAKPSQGPNATYMLDTNFYRQPTPGNLSSVREFATADKQQVLKINFTSDDKDPFLQKLQKQFAQEPYKITSCKNNTKLFEVQTNPYQVFILSSNAVSVLIKPTGYPATAALRKQLCNFNAALAW